MPGKRVPEDQRREQILSAAYRVALRQRLANLSSRAVASEAGISNGLLFFHFSNRKELLLALLDWLLEKTILRRAAERSAVQGKASQQLVHEITKALHALPEDRHSIELFFDFWFMSAQDEDIRERIRLALKRYRNSYLPLARAAVAEKPKHLAGVSGECLADMATTFLEGCALRLIVEPRSFDVKAYPGAIAALFTAK